MKTYLPCLKILKLKQLDFLSKALIAFLFLTLILISLSEVNASERPGCLDAWSRPAVTNSSYFDPYKYTGPTYPSNKTGNALQLPLLTPNSPASTHKPYKRGNAQPLPLLTSPPRPTSTPVMRNMETSKISHIAEIVSLDYVPSIYLYAIEDTQNNPLAGAKWRVYTAEEQCFDALPEDIKKRSSPWISPPNVNIYATIALKEQNIFVHADLPSFSVARVLEGYGLPVKFRFPNDLLINGKKVFGFAGTSGHNGHCFYNLCLNVNMSQDSCEIVDQPATSLFLEKGVLFDKQQVLEDLILELHQNTQLLKTKEFLLTMHSYMKSHILYLGEEVGVLEYANRIYDYEGTINQWVFDQEHLNWKFIEGVSPWNENDKSGLIFHEGVFTDILPSGGIIFTIGNKQKTFGNGSMRKKGIHQSPLLNNIVIEEPKPQVCSTPIINSEIKILATPVEEQKATLNIFPPVQGKIKVQITYPAPDIGMQVVTFEISQEAIDKANSAGLGEAKPGQNGKGLRWQDSEKSANGIRLMPGDSNAQWDSQKENYVHIRRDGKVIGPDQQEVKPNKEFPDPGSNPIAHIKEKEWLKWAKPLGEQK